MARLKQTMLMKRVTTPVMLVFAAIGILSILSCMDQKKYKSPPGYDLNNPVKYNMPDDLAEISGIAFRDGKSDSLYAEEDESGRVYYFKLGDKTVSHSKFGKSGDYEDIAILRDQVIMLRSDGTFFTFPFKDVRNPTISNVKEQGGLIPEGEYEGMYADDKTGQLYVLCKQCADDKGTKICSGYTLQLAADGTIKKTGQFGIDVKAIEDFAGKKKFSFRPSALAKNQQTNEWYVLSSVNKCIVVTDAGFKIKAIYPINPSTFLQPEGIAFDNQNNLYISNEGDKISPGTVLKFNYKK